MRGRLLAFFCFVLLCSIDAFAGVRVVAPAPGPGVDHVTIQDAVDSAAAGDIVLVKSGSYPGFTVDAKSVVISADLGHVVTVAGQVVVQNIGAAQSVAISGLAIQAPSMSGQTALACANSAGPILIENCDALGAGFLLFVIGGCAVVSHCAQVSITDCSFALEPNSGPLDAMSIDHSNVAMYDCIAIGGNGRDSFVTGARAVRVDAGFLLVSGSTLTGGTGANGTSSPIVCTNGGNGGIGLEAVFGATVRRLDSLFQGGPGGAPGIGPPGCAAGSQGAASTTSGGATVIQMLFPARHYAIPSPAREGAAATLTFTGFANDNVFGFFSIAQSPAYSFLMKGMLVPAPPQLVLTIGPLPPSGVLSIPVVLPPDLTVDGVVLYEQALFHNPVGGFVLSNPRLGIVLDASY